MEEQEIRGKVIVKRQWLIGYKWWKEKMIKNNP